MSSTVLQRLSEILPPGRILSQQAQLAAYESDALTAFHAKPVAVVIPESNEEVQTDVDVIEQRRRRQCVEVRAVGQQSDEGHNGRLRHTSGWSGSHAMDRISMVLDAAIA